MKTQYQSELDVLIEEIGSIQVNSFSQVVVEIRKYDELPPRIAIMLEKTDQMGRVRRNNKLPRLEGSASIDIGELMIEAGGRLAEIENTLDE